MIPTIPFFENEKTLMVYNTIIIVWYGVFAILMLYLYLKSFKPYKTEFNDEFYTQIPSDLNLIELSNLINRNLNANTLAAYIINLINMGKLKIEVIDDKEYITKGAYIGQMTIGDEATIKLLLGTMGDGNKVSISDIYNFCERKKNKTVLLMEYQIWCKIMRKENYRHIFFETKEEYGLVKFIAFCGVLIFFVNVLAGIENFLGYSVLVPIFILLLIFSKIYKRTREANEEYKKWIAFKEYLDNINSFDIQVTQPEEYITYGTCLGIKGLEAKITNHNYCDKITEAINRSVVKAILSQKKII